MDAIVDANMDSDSSASIPSSQDSQGTEDYSHISSQPSSQETELYYKEAKWGPIRLYTEASLGDYPGCLRWCMDNQLVFSQMQCRRHRRPRTLRDLDSADRRPNWFCGQCNDRKPVFAGSIFDDAHLPIQKILMLAYSFATSTTYEDAKRNCIFHSQDPEITNQTIASYYDTFRQIVGQDCQEQIAIGSKIGGPGKIVQVDEAMLGKRKYNRGLLFPGTWVFGMIDEDGDVRLEIVERRDQATLLSAIIRNVQVGSIIHSDSFRSYQTETLESNGYTHFKVNHRREFVAEDGTHTQKIESQWRALKRHFSPGGIRKEYIADHLLEYAWRRKCLTCNIEPFNDLIKLAKAI